MTDYDVVALAIAVVLFWAIILPGPGAAVHDWMMTLFGRLGRRPFMFVVACGLCAGIGAGLEAWFVLWPMPSVHDEFCYVLQADTFASGRLTNPTHPMWEHFETFHQLHQPSYQAKYPPAQGLTLALGMLAGKAAYALWLQSALMCGAISWLLFGWLPRRWAVLGSIVTVLQFGIVGYWVQSFWGGCVAAMGGALLYGALPRVLRWKKPLHAFVLGVGVFVLANSRPYEGLVASLPAALLLFVWLAKTWEWRPKEALRVVVPLGLVLAAGAAWMAYYNYRVTGDPLLLPYVAYNEQYSRYSGFLWLPNLPTPEFRHPILEDYALNFQEGTYAEAWHPLEYFHFLTWRWFEVFRFFLGVLAVPLLMLPLARTRRIWVPLATTLLVLATAGTTTHFCTHYMAPMTGMLVLLVMSGWRRLGTRSSTKMARALSSGVLLALIVVTGMRMVKPVVPNDAFHFGYYWVPLGKNQLRKKPGKDLVLVSYRGQASLHHDFVFNMANIDDSDIIMARDMGREKNQRIIDYYPDRHVWSLVWRGSAEWPDLHHIRFPECKDK